MLLAEATALKATLTNLLPVYLTNAKILDQIKQWRDAVDGCAYGNSGQAEEATGRDPGGIMVSLVANLPTAVSAGNGAEAIVTDSTVATNGGTVVGGGAIRVLVRSNGTNWLIV
jgi:hypothetical protein